MIANYHTHTKRCHHAKGEDEQYVRAAIKAGLEIIGFSDHGPWPYEDFASTIRMTVDEAQDYIDSVRKLREKYKDKIEIRLGFEWEYFPQHLEWLKKFSEDNKLDYIILGHHYVPYEIGGEYTGRIHTPQGLVRYCGNMTDAINSGAFTYVAHPDLFMREYEVFDDTAREISEKICVAAKEKGLPLEYNVLGLRKSAKAGRELYPHSEFWKIAKNVGNKVIIGIDAHSPKHITDARFIRQAETYLEKNGFEIIEKL
ncbi:MAG: histidinol-phosphatase [Oscillospiraceae bacterium]|nr:histidinol-phosphatase [Oscillospiraceae bacterium]